MCNHPTLDRHLTLHVPQRVGPNLLAVALKFSAKQIFERIAVVLLELAVMEAEATATVT